MRKAMIAALCGFMLTSAMGCAVVSQDEVGVKRTFGRLQDQTYGPGLYAVNPFTTTMLRLPVRTQNLEIQLDLPSQEGVSVASVISILYRVDGAKAHEVLRKAGPDYEREIILSIFRSAAADVCARFMAKDMHSGERAVIERAIQERMMEMLEDRGFIIESVLMKSISLPVTLARSIESRLAAEQDALRMKFVLESERQEAQRKMIAATGERDAQKVLAEGLTPTILKLRAIEAFSKLANSPNTKVIITQGNTLLPVELDEVGEAAD
ncbi:MAG: prohibitin family protein [Myxococcota bacterium]